MAQKEIISIETGQAVQSIGDLRKNIKEYKKQLDDANLSAGDHHAILARLQENQAALRNAMHATTATFTDITNAATAANVALDENNNLIHAESLSYNELVRKLDILKQQWRSTTNAAERLKLGEQINAVNNRLKQMDASVGVYGRNVGNYIGAVDHLTASLGKMGRGAAGVVNPIRNATGALQVMSKTPAIAILGLLANALTMIIGQLKTSEENTNALSRSMSVFAGAGDLVKNVMQGLGQALATVVGWFTPLIEKIFPALKEQAEARAAITENNIRLTEMEREATMRNADDELRIAELRAQAADKANHTAKERIALLKEASDLELAISKRNQEIADLQYQNAVLKAQRAGNSKEENDALAAAYAKKVNAETAYFNKSRELTSQISEASKQATADAKAAADAERKRLEDDLKALEEIAQAIQGTIDDAGDELLAEMEADNERARTKTEARLETIRQAAQTQLDWNEILTEDEQEQAAKRYDIQQAANLRIIDALKAAYQEASTNGDLDAMLDYERQIADMEVEIEMSAAEERRRIREADAENAKEVAEQRLKVTQAAFQGTADLLGSLADLYDSNTKQTRAEAEKVKNLRVAGAFIDMLNGVVSAISTAQELGPIAGPIMAAINSASVIATGTDNINKIKSTQVSTTSAPAVVSAPSITQAPTQVRTLTTASEEDRLNRMAGDQQVFILSSDLEADRNARRATVRETSW